VRHSPQSRQEQKQNHSIKFSYVHLRSRRSAKSGPVAGLLVPRSSTDEMPHDPAAYRRASEPMEVAMPVAPIIPYRPVLGKGKQAPAGDTRSLNTRPYRSGGLACRPALAGAVRVAAGICSARRCPGNSATEPGFWAKAAEIPLGVQPMWRPRLSLEKGESRDLTVHAGQR
jgi:hypothetical protein